MTRPIMLTGICNPLVDILISIDEATLTSLGLEKGTMRLVDGGEQQSLLDKLPIKQSQICSGGSVANSIVSFAQLGGKSALMGCIGKDSFGDTFRREIEKWGVTLGIPPLETVPTGTCVSLITPDSERTMRTHLSAACELKSDYVNKQLLQDSEWLFVEGFPLLNGEDGKAAVRTAVDTAKSMGTKIAVTCSEPIVVQLVSEDLRYALSKADLLFANEEEGKALSGASTYDEACKVLSAQFPGVVITGGGRGAFVSWNGAAKFIESSPATPKDLTGAGDMFAAGFLFGISTGLDAFESVTRAHGLAKRVIEQIGARLPGDLKEVWGA